MEFSMYLFIPSYSFPTDNLAFGLCTLNIFNFRTFMLVHEEEQDCQDT